MSQATYRKQLTRLARAMERAQAHEIASALSADSSDEFVRMFSEGNLDKRLDKLQSQLEFVATAFAEFEALAITYIKSTPSTAYDSATRDGDRMLRWLLASQSPTAEQRDYIACQQARHAIESIARGKRLELVRFQELRSLVRSFLPDWERHTNLQLYLNPITTWARFVTSELLDEPSKLPADVLFFAVDGEIGSAYLELEGQALLHELEDLQPCTLNEWAMFSRLGDRTEIAEFAGDLAGLGLVAFG